AGEQGEPDIGRNSDGEECIRERPLPLQIESVRDDSGRHDEGKVAGIERRYSASDRRGKGPTRPGALLSRAVLRIHRQVSRFQVSRIQVSRIAESPVHAGQNSTLDQSASHDALAELFGAPSSDNSATLWHFLAF